MSQNQKQISIVLISFLCFISGCVAPGAIEAIAKIATVETKLDKLEKIVEQKADNNVVAESIGEVNNKIEQTTQVAEDLSLWRQKIDNQGTINYGGGGWVVLGTGVICIIFVGAGLLIVRAFMRRGTLLELVTCAVQKLGKNNPEVIRLFKKQLRKEVSDGSFKDKDRKALGDFARKRKTFLEQTEE
jgi:hypothetical protein